MKVVPIPLGAVGIDTFEAITAPMAREVAAYTIPGTRTGITWVERVLENTTPAELGAILATGLGVAFYSESRGSGWLPSAQAAVQDAQRVLAHTRALSLPVGQVLALHIGCDLEGMSGTAADTTAYSNAWCDPVYHAGFGCKGYIGAGVPETPAGLYSLLFDLYWRSLSNVQQVAVCDYSQLQAFPTTSLALPSGALPVDLNFVQRDKRGRLPTMVIA